MCLPRFRLSDGGLQLLQAYHTAYTWSIYQKFNVCQAAAAFLLCLLVYVYSRAEKWLSVSQRFVLGPRIRPDAKGFPQRHHPLPFPKAMFFCRLCLAFVTQITETLLPQYLCRLWAAATASTMLFAVYWYLAQSQSHSHAHLQPRPQNKPTQTQCTLCLAADWGASVWRVRCKNRSHTEKILNNSFLILQTPNWL